MADVIKKQYSEETLKILEQLRLFDDDFMTKVFDENIEATELLLNIILERNSGKSRNIYSRYSFTAYM